MKIAPAASAVFMASILSTQTLADLRPLEDEALSDVTGQAFITIDNYQVKQFTGGYSAPSEEIDTEFYKINIGADLETHLSIDHLELGKFARYENGEPCPASGCDPSRMVEKFDSDVSIRNFALGAYEKQDNGTVVSKPFELTNPFLEFAFENRPNGTREVIGVRLGFEESGGILSGDIDSLTGNIDVILEGTEMVFGFIPVPIKAQALLQYDENGDPNGNNVGGFNPIRAESIGVIDGADIRAFPDLFGGINLSPENCSTSTGTDTCQPLSQFQSLEVGKASDDGKVKNFFLSQQSKDIAWVTDPNGDLTPTYGQDAGGKNVIIHENFQQTYLGGFINIPTGGLTLTPHEAAEGLPRMPTRYTDAALGLF
ncbi:DUF6160 family protein [Litoribacillus peritrichatus]|uniref:DUF6160 domain-containing protein n=1 Tax=Litoribacillus peritrichatus TaxID=718191 RepID=A0ABP7NGU0_9GAMM